MVRWVDITTGSHDQWSKELVRLLTELLIVRNDIWTELEMISTIDLADITQPGNFKARTFWTTAVLEIRRQARLADLIDHMAQRFPARRADFEHFLTLAGTPIAAAVAANADTRSAWRAYDDPLDARFVGPGLTYPMFDRSGLRSNLHLLRDQGYRSLNITGDPQSGKTFSLQLVQLLCEANDAPYVLVDIEDWGTSDFTDIDLVENLASQLRITLDTEAVRDVPDPHTRARLLLFAFRDAIGSDDGRRRWILIDGLDRPNVQPTARAFVERLLKSIEKDNKPPNTRLVITGFDGIVPSSCRRDQTGQITRTDVEQLLDIVTAGLEPPLSDDVRDGWVDDALAVYEAQHRDLGALGQEIFRLASAHFDRSVP